jgi:DNA-binding protein
MKAPTPSALLFVIAATMSVLVVVAHGEEEQEAVGCINMCRSSMNKNRKWGAVKIIADVLATKHHKRELNRIKHLIFGI